MAKSKLTPERQDEICKYIRAGNYYEVAARCAGIDKATFYRWLEKGQAEGAPKLYRDFCDAVKKAQDQAEAERVLQIRKVGMGEATAKVTEYRNAKGEVIRVVTEYVRPEWQALAWLQERQHPERWAKRERVPVDNEGNEVKQQGPAIVFNFPDGTVVRPPRNGNNGNGYGDIEHTASQPSSN